MKKTIKFIALLFLLSIIGVFIFLALTKTDSTDTIDVEIPPNAITMIPTIEHSNIDAVHYETLSAKRDMETVLIEVFIEGEESKIHSFVLPYINFVKELNPDIDDVVLKMYKSKEDYQSKRPSWLYVDGTFATLQ